MPAEIQGGPAAVCQQPAPHGVCWCILITHAEVLTQSLSPSALYEMHSCWISNQHTCVQSSAWAMEEWVLTIPGSQLYL